MKTSVVTNMVKGVEIQEEPGKIITINSFFLNGKKMGAEGVLAPSIFSILPAMRD